VPLRLPSRFALDIAPQRTFVITGSCASPERLVEVSGLDHVLPLT
jgi:hypothetical protein